MGRLLQSIIRAYQYLVSPMLGPNCRFVPSCSEYAVEALEKHGAVRGVFFGVGRLCRCHPWHAGGYDPVPPPEDNEPNSAVREN